MLLTMIDTYSCGHTTTMGIDSPKCAQPDRTTTREHDGPCADCDTRPEWERFGYPSEEIYLAAIKQSVAQGEIERAREVRIAAIAALPESERPFRGAPMRGFGTLEDLAASAGEE